MKINVRRLISVGMLSSTLLLLSGCVQYPTERQSVVDLRAQLSFRFDPADARLNDARVQVNGLDAGRMGDLLDGKGALRVRPGNHLIRVLSGTEVLLEERAYLGDGVARPFIVK